MPPAKVAAVERRARLPSGRQSFAAGSRWPDLRSLRPRSAGADGRGLSEPERVHPCAWQRQSAGDGVAARRRLLGRIRQLAAVRRHQPRAQGRRGHGLRDSSSESVWLPLPRRSRWRREVGQRQQRWHAGHRRRAGVDQGEHRRVRRQSEQRHRVRSIRRRQQGDDADGDAVGEGTVSSRDCDERGAGARRDARERDTRRRAVPRQARPEDRISSIASKQFTVEATAGRVLTRAADSGSRGRSGRRRTIAAARSVVSRRPGRVC